MPILLSFPRPLSITDFSLATSTSSFLMNLFHQYSNIFFFYKKKKVFPDPLFLSSYHSLLYSCSWSTFSKGLLVILHFLCNHLFYKVTPKGVRNNTVDTRVTHKPPQKIQHCKHSGRLLCTLPAHLPGSFPVQRQPPF